MDMLNASNGAIFVNVHYLFSFQKIEVAPRDHLISVNLLFSYAPLYNLSTESSNQ